MRCTTAQHFVQDKADTLEILSKNKPLFYGLVAVSVILFYKHITTMFIAIIQKSIQTVNLENFTVDEYSANLRVLCISNFFS